MVYQLSVQTELSCQPILSVRFLELLKLLKKPNLFRFLEHLEKNFIRTFGLAPTLCLVLFRHHLQLQGKKLGLFLSVFLLHSLFWWPENPLSSVKKSLLTFCLAFYLRKPSLTFTSSLHREVQLTWAMAYWDRWKTCFYTLLPYNSTLGQHIPK